ncbi:MAG TPA: FtsX-like permease family protein, partial [Vicinamibacteria bacterium]|nr:FtsX-like permease family protein [Vicinamibacteria bacterium]
CANAANLTLARSEARRKEMAMRAALGASRGRLLRQLALESLLLAAGGAALGLLLARALMGLVPALVPPAAITHTLDVRFDARLLAFVAVLLALTTALVAAVPAWRSSRARLVEDLKPAGAGGGADRRWSARDLIVAAQMGVSVFVLIAAGLLVRSLHYGSRLDAGFDPRKDVATFYVVPALRGYDNAGSHRFFEEARVRAAALPGVRRASYAIRLPAQANEAGWAADFVIPGKDPPAGEDAFRIRYGIVGPDYFEVLGGGIVRGRGVDASDVAASTPVAVINETMAERLWPGEDPVGKHVVMGRKRVTRQIVGVARNARIADLYEPAEMYVYVPFAQDPQGFALLLVETAGAPETALAPVRTLLSGLDPALPVLDTGTLGRHRALVLFDERRDAWIAGAVGLLGLALGATGVYGVLSLVTARRTREIGIRMALGARRPDVLRLVFGRGLRLAAVGCGLGVALGLAATRLLGSRLHGVAATDPLSFAAGVAALLAAALLATSLPALRAARIDPMTAIREE